MKLITARFNGLCAGCGKAITAGKTIAYDDATRLTYHPDCQAAATEPAPYRLSDGSGYGCEGYAPGQVLRPPDYLREQGYPDYVTAVRVGRRYYSEDGTQFGVGDESGYVYWAQCREATPEEIAPLRAAAEQAKRAREARRRVKEIQTMIVAQGKRPADAGIVRGELLLDTQDVYGGGDWFVLQPEAGWIWYIQNNGADGDDWSRNNVGTGGAGAIGWRIPFDEELAEELRQLAGLLAAGDQAI